MLLLYVLAGKSFDSEMLLETVFMLEESTQSNDTISSIGNPDEQGAVGGLKSSPTSAQNTEANLETTVTLSEEFYEVEELRKQNETLKSNITCKVCMDQKVGVLFVPCRHLICYTPCSDSIKRCPLCRQRIIGTIKAFL